MLSITNGLEENNYFPNMQICMCLTASMNECVCVCVRACVHVCTCAYVHAGVCGTLCTCV